MGICKTIQEKQKEFGKSENLNGIRISFQETIKPDGKCYFLPGNYGSFRNSKNLSGNKKN
jgi:hypothetical protein